MAFIVLVAYAAILTSLGLADGVTSFLHVGSRFTQQSDQSSRISNLPSQSRVGYDGQFAYFIALDPLKARYYMGNAPAYRYGRILYPAVGWLVAAGQPGAFPYSFLIVNVLAVAGTVFLLAGYLRRRSVSPWWAAVYGFFPGVMLCVLADLTEPLAFFLVACGLVVLERWPHRVLVAGACFGLASLGRETSLVFALVAAVAVALRGRRRWRLSLDSCRAAALLTTTSILPLLLYWFALQRWLGTRPHEASLSAVPLGGYLSWPFDSAHRLVLLAVIVPGLAWVALSASALVRGRVSLPLALAGVNAALFVVWLPEEIYLNFASAVRASIGLALAAVLALPILSAGARRGVLAARAGMLMLTLGWSLAASGLSLLL